MRSRLFFVFVLAIIIVLSESSSILAQPAWWYPERGSALTLEIQKPHYNSEWDPNRSILNTVGFIGGRHYVSDNLILFWEVPFVNLDVREENRPYYWECSYNQCYYWFEEDQLTIGNPVIGLEQPFGNGGFFASADFRFPLASEDQWPANALGISTAFDRFEAFLPKVYTTGVDFGWREPNLTSPLDARITIGTSALRSTEGGDDLYIDYSVFLGFTSGKVSCGSFNGGRILLTQNDLDFSERLVSYAGLVARLKLGAFEPGVQWRINIDEDLRQGIDYAFGFNLAVSFGVPSDYSGDSWK